jgi:diguanylate cyclase (GGDEF)-like protein/PAS domain S-box-containing protein
MQSDSPLPDAVPADPTERRPTRSPTRRWVGSNVVSLLAFVAVLGALIASVAVVRASAGSKDNLRRAQVALAGAPGALGGVLGSPEALLAGQPVGSTELPLNKKLRDQLDETMGALNAFWHSHTATTLRAETALVNAQVAEMMGLIAQHRLGAANALHNRSVQPLSAKLEADIVHANIQLSHEIRSADQTAMRATLGVVGVAGVLLLLLLVGLKFTRRRRLRDELEQHVLRESERRLQALVEHGSDMITVVEPDTTIIYQAGAVGSMLGYAPRELHGVKLTEWLEPEDIPALHALCATPDTANEELRLRHRDGSQRTCEMHATNLLNDPAWEAIVLNIWDLSDRKALEERLRHQAFHDALTGLPNRALVLDRAQQMLARARRGSSMVAALFVDLDGFKHVNDNFGHAAGDELLKVVAERLQSVVREQDTVGRLGGDEFVVLLEPGAANVPPQLVTERLLEVLRQPIELEAGGKVVSVSASIGLATGREGTVDELLRDADFALYEAKRMGKDRFVLFEMSMQIEAQDRLALESELIDALDAEQFFLNYQPTFDLHTQRVTGVEALIRWQHPTRGVLAPDIFIPIAEDTRLIVPIGRWVLHEATMQLAAWHADGHQIGMSVNVSAVQLNQDGLVDDVAAALAQSNIDPSSLTLEITETALMRDIELATVRLQALKALGVRIAIDDFGTGHSSLAYLRRFPVDALKIDRSFISGIESSHTAEAIIRTLVQLGKTLEIETLAEGIEMPDQLEKLQEEQCDQGQGFLFARPLDVAAVEAFLESHRPKAALTPTGTR